MKTFFFAVGLLLVAVVHGFAQTRSVSVEVVLEQEQFLPNEEIRVAVRITNFSGQPLHLGKENDWLTFFIESRERAIVEKYGNPPVTGEFTVDSSMTATRRVDIAPFFDVQKPGRYQLVARVKLSQWNEEIVSPIKNFDIARGSKLKELEFGVPQQTASAPEVRKYILQKADYLKEMKLYVRVTDATEARTFKVFPLARMISFGRPEAEVDRFSNLHVLHQISQRSFNYCVVNPDGQIITRQTHDYHGDSRPRLQMTDEGRIIVHGGLRRVTENDLPPAETPTSSTITNAEQPKL